MSQQKIILVAGPTAAGKSAFALDLAQRHQGVIINADAMQIYQALPILSAQPLPEPGIDYRLYGVMDPATRSSAGKWVALARAALRECKAAGKIGILVGGTGLYFKALLGGLAEIPDIPEEMRAETQALYDTLGEVAFRQELAKIDAVSATKLARNDRQRLTRAYEVARHTGKALHEWHAAAEGSRDYEVEAHLLMPERDALYAACDLRFKQMIDQGAISEAEAFLARGLSAELPAMKTLGLRELGDYLNGVMTLDAAIAKAQQMTRNYAKRQMTWFRHQWSFG